MRRDRIFGDIDAASIAMRLGALAPLAPHEKDLLHKVGAGPRTLWRRKSLLPSADDGKVLPRYLVSGWAACVRELRSGRRQLIHLILPGDALNPLLSTTDQQRVQCLTPVETIDGSLIRLAARQPNAFPGIAAAVDLSAAQEFVLMSEHATRLGQMTAYERMANLFIELHRRCAEVSMAQGDAFPLPLTQEQLGDLLGLSVVHVNRTLKQLRLEGMIELEQGWANLLKRPELLKSSHFRAPQLSHRSPSIALAPA